MRILATAWILATPCFGAGPSSLQATGPTTIILNLTQPGFGQLGIVVKDSSNNGVPNVQVTFSAPSSTPQSPIASGGFPGGAGSSATVVTNAAGAAAEVLLPNSIPGTYLVSASCFTATFQVLTVFWTVTNVGAPSNASYQGGNAQQTVVGTPFQSPLAVRVTDAAGYPLASIPVGFQCPPTDCVSAGTSDGFQVITKQTDSNGIARYVPSANGLVGVYSVQASVPAIPNYFINFNLTNIPVTMPASLTAAPGSTPQSASTGSDFVALGVYLKDANDNPVAGVPIGWATPATAGSANAVVTVTAASSVTNVLGYAFATAKANSVAGGPYIVKAFTQALGVIPDLSAQFNLTNVGTASTLTPVTGSTPQSTTVGTPFARPLAVTVKDSAGNPLSSIPVKFTVPVVLTGSAAGTFSNGTSAITVSSDTSGVASTAFTANQVAGSYTVSATAGLLSTTFSLTNTASSPTITQQPSSLTVRPGSTATFTAAATGTPVPIVKWQADGNGNGVFADIAGATATSLSFTATLSQNGTQFRAVFSSGGATATTSAATLTVSATGSTPPTITAILNNSSRIPMGYPNYGIAPSSLFVIQGTGLADPGSPVLQDSAHGLQTTLNGASIAVTVNGKTTQPAIYYTSPTQIAAVLPAATPIGAGTITVTYRGTASAAFPIKVIASALGFTTYNGSALATDAVTGALLTYVQSGKPGEIVILWSTGLGADPADSDTTYTSSPHSVPVNLQMFIGGIKADVIYQGASVYPGVSVIGVTIPSTVQTGCYVPVAALIDSVPSNIATLPITRDGGLCRDVFSGLDGKQITQTDTTTTYKMGTLSLFQNTGIVGGAPTTSASALAGLLQVSTSFTPAAPAPGSCFLSPTSGSLDVTGLNSGTVTLTPPGASPITMTGFAAGEYSTVLTSLVPGGTYKFQGSGGTQVGGFQVNVTVPNPVIVWTNQASAATVNRGAGLPITWTGGAAGTLVNITGFATSDDITVGFSCLIPVETGQFTVPSHILLGLPAGSGHVILMNSSSPSNFSASGLDFGMASASINIDTAATFK